MRRAAACATHQPAGTKVGGQESSISASHASSGVRGSSISSAEAATKISGSADGRSRTACARTCLPIACAVAARGKEACVSRTERRMQRSRERIPHAERWRDTPRAQRAHLQGPGGGRRGLLLALGTRRGPLSLHLIGHETENVTRDGGRGGARRERRERALALAPLAPRARRRGLDERDVGLRFELGVCHVDVGKLQSACSRGW